MGEPSGPFEAFVGEHYDSVFRSMSVGLQRQQLAKEAADEAFTRAYARWTRLSRAARPAAWVHVAATRAGLRRVGGAEAVAPVTSEPDSLERAIEDLPVRLRIALVLHHHAALRPEESGRALRCSPAIARATLREAHRRLGVELDDEDIPAVDLDEP